MPAAKDEDEAYLEELAGYLTALGHPRRLELLRQLRVPRTLGEIQLRPWRAEGGDVPDRAMTRNAVERHVQLLRSIGVLARRNAERDGRAVDEYLLQHQRLFQVVEELRELTQLRPVELAELEATAGDAVPRRVAHASGPRLVLLSGPVEGRTVALAGAGPWLVGRDAACDVSLDHDAFASGEHARVSRDAARGLFSVTHLPAARNPTLVDWAPIRPGVATPLEAGDVIRVGRTLLLFRA